MADIVAAGNVGQRLAQLAAREGFAALVRATIRCKADGRSFELIDYDVDLQNSPSTPGAASFLSAKNVRYADDGAPRRREEEAIMQSKSRLDAALLPVIRRFT